MQYNFLISTISDLGGIPLSEYDEMGNVKNIFCSISDRKDTPPYIAEQIKNVITALGKEDFAFQYLGELPICICGCKVKDTYYIWGPVAYRYLNQLEKKKYLQVSGNRSEEIKDLYFCSLKRLFTVVAAIYSIIMEQEYNVDYFFQYIEEHTTTFPSYDAQIVEYILNREDTLMLNHTYVEEQVAMDKIRNGEVENLKQILKNQNYKYPLVIEDNVLKNEEYMAVASITMSARAAIEGGATSAESFAISDIYLKRISKCRSISDIKKNTYEASIVYAELVRKYLDHKSSYSSVEDCKKYIAQNLFKKISLSDIAKALQINASYLSKLFSHSEGMTVSEHIHKEKINAAKNMLKYSDRSVFEISEYLQFSTQSYFSSIFKKLTGMTPQEYRSKNHPPEF